jgi:phosphate transport system substrate-binding protein
MRAVFCERNAIKYFAGIALALFLSLCAGCFRSAARPEQKDALTGRVSISGSSALLPLLKAAQEEFYKRHGEVTVNISAGGSFTGQNQAFSGVVDIGASDVKLQDFLQGKGMSEFLLANIPFVFIAHKDLPLDNLTKQQYSLIFSGRVANWRDMGGPAQPIVVIGRPLSSGARAAVAGLVLDGGKFSDEQIVLDSNGAVAAAVESTPGSLGYVDAAYVNERVKVLAYDGKQYSVENALSGKYPILAPGRLYTKGEPRGAAKAFLDFILSEEFQKGFVRQNGFVPLL